MQPVNNIFQDGVRERDLDNFLVEELSASPEFRAWMLNRLAGRFRVPSSEDVRVRKSPPRFSQDGRQTDVQIGWFEKERLLASVLIESKVGADFQNGQPEAYKNELAALRSEVGHLFAAAVIVAPASRLSTLVHHGAFDEEIAVEELVEFLASRLVSVKGLELKRRIEVRIELLEAICGKRPSAGWVATTIPEKRDFAEAYAALASEVLPDLPVRPSTDGPKALTRLFDVSVPGLPGIKLWHEFGRGEPWKYANVQFPRMADRRNEFETRGLLESTPYTVERAGGSLAIRLPTPGIDPMRPFEEQREEVLLGLEAISDLVTWLRRHSSELARVFRG